MWLVLRRLIDPALVDDIKGDLTEERARRARTSPASARLWYWRQAAGILGQALGRAAADRGVAMAQAWRALARRRHIRHACRSLRNAPSYSATIVGVMALSLALATTVFAVVDGVLFKPLPYPESHELVFVDASTRTSDTAAPGRVSLSDIAAWREALPAVRFSAFRVSSSSRLEDVNDLPFGVAEVQADFFDVVGMRPLLGGFAPEHFSDTSNVGATILSYTLWQTRFGGDPGIVGSHVTRGTSTMAIVGVMPRDFVFPGRLNAQVLMPLVPSASERTSPRSRSFDVIARIPAELSRAAAAERIEWGMAGVAKAFPPMPPPPPGARYANVAVPFDRAELVPIGERLSARSKPLFLAVSIAAASLVLLGCVNVSGLMAARGFDRTREISLRRALGAQMADITGLIVAEAVLLAGAGTVLGLALSYPLLNVTLGLLPLDLPLLKTPGIDLRVTAFAVLAMMAAVGGTSAWPICRGLRPSGLMPGSEGSRSATPQRAAGRSVVIASQTALGLMLVLGGTLFVGSIVKLRNEDVGMSASGVTAIELRIPAQVIDRRPGIVEAETTHLLAAVRAMPGVAHAGATDGSVFRNVTWSDLAFRVPAGARSRPAIAVHGVSDGFFETLQLQLRAGRLPSAAEIAAGREVLVVSQSVATAYWPDSTAVGQLLQTSGRSPKSFEVVGVVADARFNAWDDSTLVSVYGPMKAIGRNVAPSILVRTAPADAGLVLTATLRLAGSRGPELRAIRAQTLDAMMAETIRPRRLQSWLFGSFAVAALAIVGVGILGLMAMTLARRVREIGVRIALGATRRSVVMLVIREQLGSIGAGLLAGTMLSLWLVRFVSSYLYELTPYDPVLWMSTVALVVAMAIGGALIPAIRAGRVDPVRALRTE
jgi:predicted permease